MSSRSLRNTPARQGRQEQQNLTNLLGISDGVTISIEDFRARAEVDPDEIYYTVLNRQRELEGIIESARTIHRNDEQELRKL